MKGLVAIPTRRQLAHVYDHLNFQRGRANENRLSVWSQWARLDPRLAEMLVMFLAREWKRLAPGILNEQVKAEPWPAALGVLLEQVVGVIAKTERDAFRAFTKCCMSGIQVSQGELFFIGHRVFGGKLSLDDAMFTGRAYKKWGYLGREILVNKPKLGEKTWTDSGARRQALRDLARGKRYFTVSDYMKKLGLAVSRRQAQVDLTSCPWLKSSGRTRSRIYAVVGRRPGRAG